MHGRGIAIGCCLVLLLALALGGYAQSPPPGPQGGPMPQGQPGPPPSPPAFWKDATAVEALQLTADQVTALEKLDAAFRDGSLALRSDIEKAHLELELAFRQDKLDEKAIQGLAAKIGGLESKMAVLHIEQQLRVKLVLNPTQRKKIDAMGPFGHQGARGMEQPCQGGRS